MLNYLQQLEASEKLTPMHDNSTIKINIQDKKKKLTFCLSPDSINYG
jgi:hypothetical protein